MAKKVILKDHNNNEIMPITRGELILDSSGNEALHSNEFLATDTKPGLMSKEDKLRLINMSAGAYGDADTVDGKHASDFLSVTGGEIISTNHTPLIINSLYPPGASQLQFKNSNQHKAIIGYDSKGAFIYNSLCSKYINITDSGICEAGGYEILSAGNYNLYSPKLDGTGASGTWGINITGNALTATTLTTNAGSATQPVYFSNGIPVAGNRLEAHILKTTTNTNDNYFWSKVAPLADVTTINIVRHNAESSSVSWLMPWSPTLVFGISDTRGLLSIAYRTPKIVFGGGTTGNDKTNPNWTISLLGTSNCTYTLPTKTSTLASIDDIPTNYVTLDTVQAIKGIKYFENPLYFKSLDGINRLKLASEDNGGAIELGSNEDSISIGRISGSTNTVLSVLNIKSNSSIFTGNVTASKFITSNGTSSQFLKADGSLDNNTYALNSDIPTKTSQLIKDDVYMKSEVYNTSQVNELINALDGVVGGIIDTWRPIHVQNSSGSTILTLGDGSTSGDITLKAGTNLTASVVGSTVTFDTTYNLFDLYTQSQKGVEAYNWGNHAGKYLPLSGGTLTGALRINNNKFITTHNGQYILGYSSDNNNESNNSTTKAPYIMFGHPDYNTIIRSKNNIYNLRLDKGAYATVLDDYNYTSYINSTNFPGLVGVRNVTINEDYLKVNTNGVEANLTIPYAKKSSYLISSTPLNSNFTLNFYADGAKIGTAIGNAYNGSSNDYTLYSFPGISSTGVNNGIANIMNLRLQFYTSYFHDIFASPNTRYLWHRNVFNSVAKSWSRIVEEDSDDVSTIWNTTVTKANTLTTPRTLWGQSFDGSANVTGDMTGVGNINYNFKIKNNTDNIATLNIEAITVVGGVNYSHLYVTSNTGNNNTRPLVLQNGYGNVGIGVVAPTQKLEVNGNVKANTFLGNLDWSYIQNKPTSLPANGGNADTINGYHSYDLSMRVTVDLPYNKYIRITVNPLKSYVITLQGTNGDRNGLYFITGYNDGTTVRNSLRVIKKGPYDIYINGTSETSGCFYIKQNYWTNGLDTITIFPTTCSYTIIDTLPSDAVLVSSDINNILATQFDLSLYQPIISDLETIRSNATYGKTAYDWYKSITQDDTDTIINKWGEIVDFIDSVAEGTDIMDEFVTRKTEQTITGVKTFATNILTISNPNGGDATLKFYRGGNTAWNIINTGGNLKFNDLISNTTRLVLYESAQGGSAAFAGQVTATKFITSGGTSSQFVKGDGSLDSTEYFKTSSLWRKSNSKIFTTKGWKRIFVGSYLEVAGRIYINHTYTSNANKPVIIDFAFGYLNASEPVFNVYTYSNVWTQARIIHGSYTTGYRDCYIDLYYNGNVNSDPSKGSGAYSVTIEVDNRTNSRSWDITMEELSNSYTPPTDSHHYTYVYDLQQGNWFNHSVIADKLIKSGGTSSQFLKADGSVDSTSYATSASLGNYLPLTGGILTNGGIPAFSELSTNNDNTYYGNNVNNILTLISYNNLMTISLDSSFNSRYGYIQVGHSSSEYGTALGKLSLNPFGGNVFINNHLALHVNNYNSYVPKLDGTGASGTWNIDINGSAKKLTTIYCNKANANSKLWDIPFRTDIANTFNVYEINDDNCSLGTYVTILDIVNMTGTTFHPQIAITAGATPLIYIRNKNWFASTDTHVFGDWRQLAFKSEIPTKLSQLTDDVVAGKYLPLTGGTMTGDLRLSGDNLAMIRNVKLNSTTGWARNILALQVDGVNKFEVGGFGSYTIDASDNDINYVYLSCNSWNGLGLRISPTELKWGDNIIWHSGNDGATSGLNADLLDGYHASSFALKTDLGSAELENNITTISKTLTVTQDWMDTGIKHTDLPNDGTYIIQIHTHNSTDDLWRIYWSGIMSWFRQETNAVNSDEIILHRAGHAYKHTIYLRTIMTARSDGRNLRLQIAADTNLSTASTYTFKFKRVI